MRSTVVIVPSLRAAHLPDSPPPLRICLGKRGQSVTALETAFLLREVCPEEHPAGGTPRSHLSRHRLVRLHHAREILHRRNSSSGIASMSLAFGQTDGISVPPSEQFTVRHGAVRAIVRNVSRNHRIVGSMYQPFSQWVNASRQRSPRIAWISGQYCVRSTGKSGG